MPALAHSARPNKGISAQLYEAHVVAVVKLAQTHAAEAAAFCRCFGDVLRAGVRLASEFHDLGKLDPENQQVLGSNSRERLPVNHIDAGVAHLLHGAESDLARQLAALAVYAHHPGLPALAAEGQKCENCFRDCHPHKHGHPFRKHTDGLLARYLETHYKAVSGLQPVSAVCGTDSLPPLLARVALSCLADADHADTAQHYGAPALMHAPGLAPHKRLEALDTYVADLSVGRSDERTRLRTEIYSACRCADPAPPMLECDSPVGSGKTTAIMAHLLQAAQRKQLRRVFVVLPFTNIIDQSVEVYRRCLLFLGEQPEEVVAAHHHRADYGKPDSRHLAALWRAPVVVTTAVQFFETLAGRFPAALRKLHQVPGSAIFLDESHACLPAHLWPQAWDWLTQLATDWDCHIVLGSGSLNRLWRLPEFAPKPVELPALVHSAISTLAAAAETERITYRSRPEPVDLEQLTDWLKKLPGPRLVIVNTVQTAAALAQLLEKKHYRECVEHLSTALTPWDRARELTLIKLRLNPARKDTDWTLVATSCVEAGVDVSFRTGLRERASLTSLIQIGGRANRSGEYGSADVWDFQLRPGGLVAENPGYRTSALVLGQLFDEHKVAPTFCTEALRREIRMTSQAELNRRLREAEQALDFPEVEALFQVIGKDTVTAVVDTELQKQLDKGVKVDWRQLQQKSVQIYTSKVLKFGVSDFAHFPDIKRWSLEYDAFLGYMVGVLKLTDLDGTSFIG